MDTRDDTSSIIREGYWSYDYEEQLNEEFRYYEEQKEKEQELKLNQKGS